MSALSVVSSASGRGIRILPMSCKESVDAIYGLGMFQAVTPRVLNPNEQGAPMDVEISVRERKPRSVQLGFGFSTVEQFRGEVQWTHRNLWGGAE